MSSSSDYSDIDFNEEYCMTFDEEIEMYSNSINNILEKITIFV